MIRDILRWMEDSDGTKARVGSSDWDAFCDRIREELAFGPAVDADMTSGERLGKGDDDWHRVLPRISAHEILVAKVS